MPPREADRGQVPRERSAKHVPKHAPERVPYARPRPVRGATVASTQPPAARVPAGGVPGRRTVTIQGRGSERYTPSAERRRPPRRAHERAGFRPDRAAMWAVLLGVLLVFVAATSSHAAVISSHPAVTRSHPAVTRSHAAIRSCHVGTASFRAGSASRSPSR